MPNDYHVIMTKKANQDLEDLGDSIAYTLFASEDARRFISGLRKAIVTLSVFPYRHPLVEDEFFSRARSALYGL